MTFLPHKTANKIAHVSDTTFAGKEWCKSRWLAQRGLERGISETGYSYFGARYYDSDLSGLFLSVDPMADKYPGISPYNYCMWNPVKLVDPDGRIIDSASVTQNIKNMIDPTHECYNAEFAAIYQCLDDDRNTTYRFEKWDSFHKNNKNQDISGAVSLSEDKTLIIGYNLGIGNRIRWRNRTRKGIVRRHSTCKTVL